MIYILHISDLHFVKNAATYQTEEIVREEVAYEVKNVPQGQKLLVVTGDFHNFADKDYQKAEVFITELASDMGLDMGRDVFVIPGNHDVGNNSALKHLLEPEDPKWELHKKSALEMIKKGDTDYLDERLMAFRPYCIFVQRLGIYDSAKGKDYPASAHVRSWRGKLNILHLNTALVADGITKTDQVADADTAAAPETWRGFYQKEIPAVVIGHNSFYDLQEGLRKSLATTFALKNVSAYICGDRHRLEEDPEQQMIRLESGFQNGKEIPNLVAAKGIADSNDTYSDVGYSWHLWDEKTDTVTVKFRKWTRNTRAKTVPVGEDGEYTMFRDRSGKPIPPSDPGTTSKAQSPLDNDIALINYLDDVLKNKKDSHPSFRLLKKDKVDERPSISTKESEDEKYDIIPSQGKIENSEDDLDVGIRPVWDIIQSSWSIKDHRSIVITGEGGIGKTVALFSKPRSFDVGSSIPALYIALYELVDTDKGILSIDDHILKNYRKYCDRIDSLTMKSWNDRPQILILLDGFNELPVSLRREALRKINSWHDYHPGAQLIAVSRPMDGVNLSQELAGDPISITLTLLEKEEIRKHISDAGQRAPSKNSPIWENLQYPLFLNLYIKTGKLSKQTAAGYPLRVKSANSGGALIWNYLQRELIRYNVDNEGRAEDWVIRCSVANEYILPYIAHRMVSEQRMGISFDITVEWIDTALEQFNPRSLPKHLSSIWRKYRRQHGDYPRFSDISKITWYDTVLQESGILIPSLRKRDTTEFGPEDENYSFMHQNFRDCLAGLYLVNYAECSEKGKVPEVWRHGLNYLALNYASELIDPDIAKRLWESNRTSQQYGKTMYERNHTATCNLLELFSRDEKLTVDLDFSGMDLCGLSLVKYLTREGPIYSVFMDPQKTNGCRMDRSTFRINGHQSNITSNAVLPDGRIVSGSLDNTLRVWDASSGQCLQTLAGHTDSVNCIAVLSDGLVVSGSDDHTLHVWDASSGLCLQTLAGHTDSVSCIAVLRDGRIVSGSDDTTLRVWDASSGLCLQTLSGHTASVNCIAVLSDGRIVSGSDDHTLRVWDASSGQCLQTLEGHAHWVNCIAVLTDGRIISGSVDHTLRVWDASSGQCLQTLAGHTNWVRCIAVLSDGLVVSGSDDHTLRVWDASSGQCLHILAEHTNWVRCIAVLPDGLVVSGSDDHILRVWDASSGQCLQTLAGHTDSVSCIAVLRDGRIVSGSLDNTLRVWDASSGQCLQTLAGHTSSVNCIAVLPDGRIVNGLDDHTLRVWDASSGQCLQTFAGHTASVSCIAVLSDGRIVSGSLDNTLRVWDASSGQCLQTLAGHITPVNCIAVFPDGLVVSGSDDHILRVWDASSGQCLQTLAGHTDSVSCIAVLRDGRIVSGSLDNTLRVWDASSGQCLQTLAGHRAWVNCIAVLRDGRIVSGSMDNTLRVWDASSGQCLQTLAGHRTWINCIAILRDGRIVSGSYDTTLRVWDASSGQCSQILAGHTDSVSCIAVLTDGRIISGSDDHTLRVWDVSSGQCLQTLEGHAHWVNCIAVLTDGQIVSGDYEGTIYLWNPNTGECLDVFETMEVDISRMDFSNIILTEDLARLLWQNGVNISTTKED